MSEQQTRVDQSKLESFTEAAVNTVLGYVTAMITQVIFYPVFDIHVPISDQLLLALLFTLVSLLRNYFVRRVFNNHYKAMLQWLNDGVSKVLHVPNNVVFIPDSLFHPKPKELVKYIDVGTAFYNFLSEDGKLTEYETQYKALKYFESNYFDSKLIHVQPYDTETKRKGFKVIVKF